MKLILKQGERCELQSYLLVLDDQNDKQVISSRTIINPQDEYQLLDDLSCEIAGEVHHYRFLGSGTREQCSTAKQYEALSREVRNTVGPSINASVRRTKSRNTKPKKRARVGTPSPTRSVNVPTTSTPAISFAEGSVLPSPIPVADSLSRTRSLTTDERPKNPRSARVRSLTPTKSGESLQLNSPRSTGALPLTSTSDQGLQAKSPRPTRARVLTILTGDGAAKSPRSTRATSQTPSTSSGRGGQAKSPRSTRETSPTPTTSSGRGGQYYVHR
ncbi:putative protein TPRXL [Panonychus citri]|uniref:putative protein TPRXL n=1 Tax=Panonychus citri TaxID=50023 RepID=UPI002307EFC6|nr:putative protein TPRXL [Panonychus citri]